MGPLSLILYTHVRIIHIYIGDMNGRILLYDHFSVKNTVSHTQKIQHILSGVDSIMPLSEVAPVVVNKLLQYTILSSPPCLWSMNVISIY